MSSCGEVAPIGARPKSDQFLTQERLATLARPGATREAVRQQFGELFVVSGDGKAMAYLPCETADRRILTMAVVVPFWSTASITYFQIQGIWFDAEGKVSRTRLWNGHNGPHGGNPHEPYRVPSQQQTLLWLEQHGPPKAE
jgi:hypothetical protein